MVFEQAEHSSTWIGNHTETLDSFIHLFILSPTSSKGASLGSNQELGPMLGTADVNKTERQK